MDTLPAVVETVDQICANLVDLQKKRVFAIRQQSRNDRSTEAFLARLFGYHAGLEEQERKRLMKYAQTLRRVIEEKDDPNWVPEGVGGINFEHVAAMVLHSKQSRLGWDRLRDDMEDEMRALARRLPVLPWIATVKGVSPLGLAVVTGEAGNLSNYDN